MALMPYGNAKQPIILFLLVEIHVGGPFGNGAPRGRFNGRFGNFFQAHFLLPAPEAVSFLFRICDDPMTETAIVCALSDSFGAASALLNVV